MEISVALSDAADAESLLRRLAGALDATISLDDAHQEIRVLPGDEAERTVIRVVDVVGRWLDQAGVASARLSCGDRSYTLVGGGQIGSTR